ncbi:MAG: hypothetical protein AAF333_02855 [Planctomycetota bacterium]
MAVHSLFHSRWATWVLVGVGVLITTPGLAQDAEAVEPPKRIKSRDVKELLRGKWAGTTINDKGKSRSAALTLGDGDFSAVTGRFNNWKIVRGQAQRRRGEGVTIVLFAPGTQDGQPVEKPITCVGRFDDEYRRWVGEFQGFTQTGTFELYREVESPEPESVRGSWAGHLTPSRRREGDASPPFRLNLLTGDFTQATGVVFLSDDHPAAESIRLTYFDLETREIDLELAFARPEDRRTKAARSAEFQGVFSTDFTVLEGAFRATGHGGSGTFRLERAQP